MFASQPDVLSTVREPPCFCVLAAWLVVLVRIAAIIFSHARTTAGLAYRRAHAQLFAPVQDGARMFAAV